MRLAGNIEKGLGKAGVKVLVKVLYREQRKCVEVENEEEWV